MQAEVYALFVGRPCPATLVTQEARLFQMICRSLQRKTSWPILKKKNIVLKSVGKCPNFTNNRYDKEICSSPQINMAFKPLNAIRP